MAGTLMGLGLSQHVDLNGFPLVGARLYIYLPTTTTPVVSYRVFALTAGQEHPHPIVADANGRIPAFWLADGTYRARLLDANGVVVFDSDNIPAIGASSVTTTVGAVDAAALLSTGDFKWRPQSGSLSGFVRSNGRTIGSASSGGGERANADTETLFKYLWDTFPDTYCPVLTGRGATAAADWTANKQLTLIDMRARVPVGLDDMGSSAASRLTSPTVLSGTPTTPAGWGGIDLVALSTAQLPAHTHDPGTLAAASGGAHTHGIESSTGAGAADTGFLWATAASDSGRTTNSDGAHTHTITGASASVGSSSAHGNMPPFVLGTYYIKL